MCHLHQSGDTQLNHCILALSVNVRGCAGDHSCFPVVHENLCMFHAVSANMPFRSACSVYMNYAAVSVFVMPAEKKIPAKEDSISEFFAVCRDDIAVPVK